MSLRLPRRLSALLPGRTSSHARVAVAGAVLCATGALHVLPAHPASAAHPASTAQAASTVAASDAGTPGSYAFADDAKSVRAATSTTDAELLEPGTTYRSTLPDQAEVYYRLELDATSNAYFSATAVPRPGATVSASDGIRVSVQDGDSRTCSVETTTFGAARSPRPITAWGARDAGRRRNSCQEAGTYYVVVERVGTAGSSASSSSSPDAWDLELLPVLEPPLRKAAATNAPEVWDSSSPAPLTGDPVDRAGGAGFATATPVGQGVWRADITPGQTLFYKVPVGWGRQLYATADLGSTGQGSGYVVHALDLALYNPVRADVDDANINYNGSQRSASLAPLPPVAYVNRYSTTDSVNGMRFAGSYYLAVHLSAQMADRFGDGPFGLMLRVRVGGVGESGPGYAGQPVPRDVFEVTEGDREAVAEGAAARGDTAMTVTAVGGIGAGTVLLAVLGVWTVTARRRASA
ncbi:hypothetical protein [Streptomyces sp. HUAS ZL42]|uniref:hypothetical protein n=1 Tax=Streptomyces sp. HUAS ZL42 TaxID=3231715 RepID=UPI00345E1686